MDLEELEAIRKRSKTYNPKTDTNEVPTLRGLIATPWDTDRREMYKTSVFKRHSKWQPFSKEVRRAIEHDDDEITEVKGFETAKPVFETTVLEVENTVLVQTVERPGILR
jgi:recombinational DNA repair protein RecT